MATKVHMEALSPTMEEGQVVKWHKAEGDPVSQGELLAEIETDKATMELVARGEGVLRKILRGEGRTAPVGEVIAVIAAEGEDISALIDAAGGKRGTAEGAAAPPSPWRQVQVVQGVGHQRGRGCHSARGRRCPGRTGGPGRGRPPQGLPPCTSSGAGGRRRVVRNPRHGPGRPHREAGR